MRSTRRKLALSSSATGVHPTPTDAAGASSGRDSKPCWSRPSGPVQCTARWCLMLQIRPSDSCCHSTSTSLSRVRRCQLELVLRAGDDLWRWNDARGSYQIALEEPRIIKIVQARHSSRSALSSTTAATWWWLGRGARWPCRAEIEDSDKAILLYLVARVTYTISQ